MKKALSIMLIACIIGSIIVTSYANDNISVNCGTTVSDEKIINNFFDQIEETPFTNDGSIYIIIHHDISDVGKIYDESYFPELDIEYIEDKTATSQNTVKEDYGPEFRNVLKVFLTDKSRKNIIESIEKLQKRVDKDIYWAQPSYETTYELYEQSVPGDTYYNEYQSDYFDLIDLPEVWDNYTTGNQNIKVAVFDSGIPYHEDFGVGDNNNLSSGYDFKNFETDTSDIVVNKCDKNGVQLYDKDGNELKEIHDHGLYCGSIIGAQGDNDIGITGVCWDVTLVPIQPDFSSDGYSKMIKYLNDNNILIANISMAHNLVSPSSKQVIEQHIKTYRGLLVCATGNEFLDIDSLDTTSSSLIYPAAFDCDNIMVVGASTSSDERWDGGWYTNDEGVLLHKGSNVGVESVDLFAPGVDICGIYAELVSDTSTNYTFGYKTTSGTSAAAPIVSGVAALIMSENPSLDPLQVKAIIMNTVDRSDAFIGKCVSGGRINAYRAVYVAHDLKDNAPDTESRHNSNFLFHASTNTIVKYVGVNGAPEIPSVINEVPVTKIEERAFYKNTFIRQIDIPSNITRIGEEAFKQCTALETVTVGSSIIQDRAFLGCNSLENVTLSNNLVGIGEMAFWDCNYEYISVPDTLIAKGDDAFALSSHLIVPEGSDVQNYFASKGYSMLLITGGSVSDYHNGTFVYVDPDNPGGLKNINIPESYLGTPITAIGSHAFEDADNIEMINIPTTVTSIGYRAFRGCDNLKTVVIPPSVTSISNSMNSTIVEDSPNATIYCTRASSAYGHVLQNNLSCIHMETRTNDAGDEYAVVCGLLEKEGNGTEYIIPETFAGLTVTMIDPAAFSCSMETPFNMTKMFIPETVETIGGNAFSDCTNLTDVYIYSDTATVGLYCFAGVDTSHFKIHCKSGSPAFVYAAINGYTFVLI